MLGDQCLTLMSQGGRGLQHIVGLMSYGNFHCVLEHAQVVQMLRALQPLLSWQILLWRGRPEVQAVELKASKQR